MHPDSSLTLLGSGKAYLIGKSVKVSEWNCVEREVTSTPWLISNDMTERIIKVSPAKMS